MKKENKKVAKTKVEAKGKKAAAAATPEVKAPRAINISRERLEIKTELLSASPWNPRGEISPESVADLVASISTVGIIEPLVVMEPESGKGYIIIAGHRRAKAAALAECKTVPCDVLRGIDVATAKRMTFIENLQRRDADPILESNLVAELVADGMTTDEIAAEIGRDRKWVLRRKNLSNLSPSWRKRVEKGEKITTDCLEHIAAYPAEIQEKMKKEHTHHSNALRWYDIERCFERESQNLSTAPFDTAPCKACSNNTGCAPDLFEWEGRPATLGKCLCAKCYKKKCAEHFDAIVKQAENDGVLIIRREPSYDVYTSPTRTKKCSVLYIYKPYYSDEMKVEWGEPPKKEKGSKVSEKELKKELAKKREKRDRNKAIRRLVTICATDGRLAACLRGLFTRPGKDASVAPFLLCHAIHGASNSYRFAGMEIEIQKFARAALSYQQLPTPPAGWYTVIADMLIEYLDPSKSGGYYADSNAPLVLALFPELRTDLGAEDADRILKADDVEKILSPKITWTKSAMKDPTVKNTEG